VISEGRYIYTLEDHGRSGTKPSDFARRGLFVQFNRQFLEQQGAGLGLYLVERLLSLHGGELEFLPTTGGGITVHFSLPIDS
jgi:signal transduction histidine kinase